MSRSLILVKPGKGFTDYGGTVEKLNREVIPRVRLTA